MNANTPLSQIKTTDQLLMLLASQGWRKSPTKEPVRVDPQGLVFEGGVIDGPCWENSCQALIDKWGEEQITLHPGLIDDHGDVHVCVVVRDGLLTEWVMHETYAGTHLPLDPSTVCLDDLKHRLWQWIHG